MIAENKGAERVEKLFFILDKSGRSVMFDEYYSCLRYEEEYTTNYDSFEKAQRWLTWALETKQVSGEIERPLSIVEMVITSKQQVFIEGSVEDQ